MHAHMHACMHARMHANIHTHKCTHALNYVKNSALLTLIHVCIEQYQLYTIIPQFLKERFKIDMPHRFRVHTFVGPTFCDMCGQMMHGLFRQGLKCAGEDRKREMVEWEG